jgi:glycyl-tRNA synthetase beta chain
MKNCFLFELLCEEIPHHSQKYVQKTWTNHIQSELQKVGIENYELKFFMTPRRLAVQIYNIPESVLTPEVKVKGPDISNQIAVQKFLEKYGVFEQNCEKQDVNGKICLFLTILPQKSSIESILKELCKKFVHETTGPKMMSWGNGNNNWFRPIHGIVCMLNEKVIEWTCYEIKSSNQTLGHRYFNNTAITIDTAEKYEHILETHSIIPSYEKRIEKVRTDLIAAYSQKKCDVSNLDEQLIDKIAGLVEYPSICIGSFEEKFLSLPLELISTVLKNHQNSFTMTQNNTLVNDFSFVSNALCEDKSTIISGNEKVVAARLSDASFFYNLDMKKSPEFYIEQIQNKTFHENLGTFFDKTERLKKIANIWNEIVNKNHAIENKLQNESFDSDILEAIKFSKYDLAFETVREFPELQGIIGSYYYKYYNHYNQKSLNNEIATAIHEQYSFNPESNLGKYICLFDNLDKVIGFFCHGIKPTSSGDPYAIRRSGNIAANILLKTPDISVCDLENIIKSAMKLFLNKENQKNQENELLQEIFSFMLERIKKNLQDNHKINSEIIEHIGKIFSSISSSSTVGAIKIHDIFVYCTELNSLHENRKIEEIKSLHKRISGLSFGNQINQSIFDNQTISAISALKNSNYLFVKNIAEFLENHSHNNYVNNIDILLKISPSIPEFLNNEKIDSNPENQFIIAYILKIMNKVLFLEILENFIEK